MAPAEPCKVHMTDKLAGVREHLQAFASKQSFANRIKQDKTHPICKHACMRKFGVVRMHASFCGNEVAMPVPSSKSL